MNTPKTAAEKAECAAKGIKRPRLDDPNNNNEDTEGTDADAIVVIEDTGCSDADTVVVIEDTGSTGSDVVVEDTIDLTQDAEPPPPGAQVNAASDALAKMHADLYFMGSWRDEVRWTYDVRRGLRMGKVGRELGDRAFR